MDSIKTEVWYEKVKGVVIRIRWDDFVKEDIIEVDEFPKDRLWQMYFFQLMSIKNTYNNIRELTITQEGVVKLVIEEVNEIKTNAFIEYIRSIYCGCKMSVHRTEFLKVALDDLLDEQVCFDCYIER